MDLLTLFRNYLLGKSQNSSSSTVKNYVADVNHFQKWYQETYKTSFTPEKITTKDVDNFMSFLGDMKYSGATIDRHKSSLRNFFQFLTTQSLIPQNPFTTVPQSNTVSNDFYGLKDFKNFLYSQGRGQNTIKNYVSDLQHFLDWIDKTHEDYDVSKEARLGKINAPSISEYTNRLVNVLKLSPASINRKLSSIRQYTQWATNQGLLPKNPFSENVIARSEATKQSIEIATPSLPVGLTKAEDNQELTANNLVEQPTVP